MSARFRGHRIAIDARTREVKGRTRARVTAVGELALAALVGGEHDLATRLFPGDSAWRVDLDIILSVPNRDVGGMVIHAASDLRGARVLLPVPFAKAAAEAKPLTVKARVTRWGEPVYVDFEYGDEIAGVVELGVDGGETQLARGVLRFGGGVAHLPERTGVRLSGRLKHLPLGEWLDLRRRLARMLDVSAMPLGLVDADLESDAVTWPGGSLSTASLRIEEQRDEWYATVSSKELVGEFSVPSDDWMVRPARLRLELLDLSLLDEAMLAEDKRLTTPSPDAFPPLQVSIERLKWGDWHFQDVSLASTPEPRAMVIHNLQFKNPHLTFQAQGRWHVTSARGAAEENHRTDLQLAIESDDIGEALLDFGYVDAIREGEGEIKASINWLDVLYRPDLARLQGRMDMTLRKGRLVSVDPGVGKIFGLLSLQALPRRLTLDFKDFLKEGLSFDKIKGSFNFAEGNAYSTGLKLKGPIGRIKASGKTGLIERDYAQEITVMPRYSSSLSLPLVGVVAGYPGAGLAVWALVNLLKEAGVGIEEIGELKYTLSGTWDDPKVTPVAVSEKATTERVD